MTPYDKFLTKLVLKKYDANKKPAGGASTPAPAKSGNQELFDQVTAQGNLVRELKGKKAGKGSFLEKSLNGNVINVFKTCSGF